MYWVISECFISLHVLLIILSSDDEFFYIQGKHRDRCS